MPLAPNATGRKPIATGKPASPPLRVLQVMVAAGCGLLFLKAVGIATHGGYIFADNLPGQGAHAPLPQFARALAGVRSNEDDAIITGSAGAKKKEEPHAAPKKEGDTKEPTDFKPAVTQAPSMPEPAEMQILERLRERREALDRQAKQLDMRETLLKAAEKKLEGQVSMLPGGVAKAPAADAAAPGAAPAKPGEPPARLKGLVTIYETMKPKDAARVFDGLEMRDLVEVVKAMNPRKVSDVIAAMSPPVAQKLTVALMNGNAPPPAPADGQGLPPGELPRIDAPPTQ